MLSKTFCHKNSVCISGSSQQSYMSSTLYSPYFHYHKNMKWAVKHFTNFMWHSSENSLKTKYSYFVQTIYFIHTNKTLLVATKQTYCQWYKTAELRSHDATSNNSPVLPVAWKDAFLPDLSLLSIVSKFRQLFMSEPNEFWPCLSQALWTWCLHTHLFAQLLNLCRWWSHSSDLLSLWLDFRSYNILLFLGNFTVLWYITSCFLWYQVNKISITAVTNASTWVYTTNVSYFGFI
jgi:hypothetical protein